MPVVRKVTDKECRGLRPGAKPLQAGGQLSLHPLVSGDKVWRYRYRLAGKEGVFTIGRYPEIGLAEARALRDEAAALVKEGTAPIVKRRSERDATIEAEARTLGAAVAAWVEDRAQREQGVPGAWTPEHAQERRVLIRRYLLSHPAARLPIDRVEPATIISLLNAVPNYARTPLRIILRKTFDRAIALRQTTRQYNVVEIVREEITPPRRSVSHPTARSIEDARAVLAAFDSSPAFPIAKLAHRFLALTVLRLSEAMAIRWDWLHDLDGTAPRLEIPAEAMKGRRTPHTVMLSPQAVTVLRWARRYRRHNESFVFFAPKKRGDSFCGRAITNMLGSVAPFRFVTHSWRPTFSTLMNRRFFEERSIVDQMLAHKPTGVSAAELAYNHELHLERRRVLACAWADMLLEGAADLSAICGGQMGTVEREAA